MEKKIIDLITSDYSWEQALYKIIAWEGLDPWDIDITSLSSSFVSHISKMEKMDFKIPAKYVIIAAVLLRMKSDHLDFLNEMLSLPEEDTGEGEGEERELKEIESEMGMLNGNGFDLNAITVPNKRQPHRKVVLSELVFALRKVMKSQEKREKRRTVRREQIHLKEHKISQKIDELYKKIDGILKKLKDGETSFSKIVTEWNREEVINHFLPMIYLDHQKKIECTQKEAFDEIFIRKR
ncbi:MAG: segregation/condensation protein A [Nanoarchaeota archaeon]|nr:segregation/condensation protein A [Nanoarchaeota archaeon]MBU1135802.1 segregation/condensation protein A [Nanoarchaeota archaeon]MBU2520402.1 segregation/condensation protein A [Nanoarchaeota archaeon]